MRISASSNRYTAGASKSSSASPLNFTGKQNKFIPPKLQPGELIDLNSPQLLPGFTQRDEFDSKKMQNEDLVLCHLTNYLADNGKIPSNLESRHYIRPTVHFSLNHPVMDNDRGSWQYRRYGILTPFKDALRLNGKPAGCLEVDTYWDKSVNYNSPTSVVLTQDIELPEGKAQVRRPESINLPSDSPVTVLATKQAPSQAMNAVIPKMGFSRLKPGITTWGNHKLEGKLSPEHSRQRTDFKNFMRKNRFKEDIHASSSYAQFEDAMLAIHNLALRPDNRWVFSIQDTPDYKDFLEKTVQKLYPKDTAELKTKPLNLKQELLDSLNEVRQTLPSHKRHQLHLDQLIALIDKAETPLDACMSIKTLYSLKSLLPPWVTPETDPLWFRVARLLPLPSHKEDIKRLDENILGDIPLNQFALDQRNTEFQMAHFDAEEHSSYSKGSRRSWAEVVKTGLTT